MLLNVHIVGGTLMDVRRMILVIGLNDDFSVIHAFEISAFPPECPGMPCKLMHQFMMLSFETHNYPLVREE